MQTIIKTFIIGSLLFSAACTTQVGKFTAISTNNVRGLEHAGKKRDEVIEASEKSCNHRIYVTRTLAGLVLIFPWFMPAFDISLGDDSKDRLTNAVDKAIKTGKRSVFDGDMLVNATIKEKNIIIPLIYGYKCVIAEGDVVSSVTRTKGFLEKQ